MTSKMYREQRRLERRAELALRIASATMWPCCVALGFAALLAWDWVRVDCEPTLSVPAALVCLAAGVAFGLVSVLFILIACSYERAWDRTWDHDGTDIG